MKRTTKVAFNDLSLQHLAIQRELDQAIKKVLKRGDFILGQEVYLFEQEFARWVKARFAVGTSSGTAALFLALKALGIGEGDEVIVPVFTFVATAFAVSYTGANPVFVDIDERTYNLDPIRFKQAITSKTKAVIPVHLFGQPADMFRILDIAREYKLKVIEDACQAHGACIRSFKGDWLTVGGLGDVGCFSFYPSKNLGALGDAGMIVTNDEKIYRQLLVLRDCGRVSKYEHSLIGYNARLDTLQAAILRQKLRMLNKWNSFRQKAAKKYDQLLNCDRVVLPYVTQGVRHVYHIYAVQLDNRDEAFLHLKKAGVDCLVHYPVPLHLQQAYSHLGFRLGDFPVAERLAKRILSLPIHPYISEAQQGYVAKKILEFVR